MEEMHRARYLQGLWWGDGRMVQRASMRSLGILEALQTCHLGFFMELLVLQH